MVVAYWIGCTVADLLNCIPIQWTWINSLDDPRYCFNYNIFWLVSGIVEACIDILILIMPIKMVIGLHMDTTQKLAVVAVFLLGTLWAIPFDYIQTKRSSILFSCRLRRENEIKLIVVLDIKRHHIWHRQSRT
jgi:hypothetical protein